MNGALTMTQTREGLQVLLANHYTTRGTPRKGALENFKEVEFPAHLVVSPAIFNCPVSWGCRIHRLCLCGGVRPPHPTSALDMTPNNLMVRFQ